jgi:hypothetical protein
MNPPSQVVCTFRRTNSNLWMARLANQGSSCTCSSLAALRAHELDGSAGVTLAIGDGYPNFGVFGSQAIEPASILIDHLGSRGFVRTAGQMWIMTSLTSKRRTTRIAHRCECSKMDSLPRHPTRSWIVHNFNQGPQKWRSDSISIKFEISAFSDLYPHHNRKDPVNEALWRCHMTVM